MIYIGIDPGKTGAIAVIDGGSIKIYDMPLTPDGDVFSPELFDRINVIGAFCALEKAQAMPGQGVVSTFNYGMSYGMIVSCLQLAGIAFQEIHPMKWKKEFQLVKKDKGCSVDTAMKMFPDAVHDLIKPKRGGGVVLLHGRAEALLIAEYGRRINAR
jgi:crossover junction endodeoxyribonuclease RuvC